MNDEPKDKATPFRVIGPDGVARTLAEHYDCRKDVEQDPYGAWLAIQNQGTRIEALEAALLAAEGAAQALALCIEELRCLIPHQAGAALTDKEVEAEISDYVAALTAYRAALAQEAEG